MVNQKELQETLKQFHGSDYQYKFYQNVFLTEGMMYLCENAESHWLVDIVWSYQIYENVRKQEFQLYELTVHLEKHTGKVICTDGNDIILMTQNIEFTDFPLKSIRLFYSNGVLMLPSEY